jgi:hypothetical protein
MTSHPRLALAFAAAAALAVPAVASAASARVPSRPQVRILGFSTFPRLGVPQIQARPGRVLSACYDGYNGQREVNVVWQGWGIPRGTRVGVALWGGPISGGFASEPSDADTMRAGFTWRRRKAEKVQTPYGYTFAGGPFGPQGIDGTWTAKVLLKGRVLARRQVTIACA